MVSRRLLRDTLVLAGAFVAAECLGGLIAWAEAAQGTRLDAGRRSSSSMFR